MNSAKVKDPHKYFAKILDFFEDEFSGCYFSYNLTKRDRSDYATEKEAED